MTDVTRRAQAPLPLLVGFALFLSAIGYLVASSLSRRTVPTYTPTAARQVPRASRDSLTLDTLTVDARDSRAWRFIDVARGTVVAPPDTAGWELAIRRHHVIAADAIADAGELPFDAMRSAPSQGYVVNRAATDTTNPAIARWYRYSFLTHLLEPAPRVYVVRTRSGEYVKLQVLGYYCPGPTAGCMTIRYGAVHPPPTAGAIVASP